MHTPDVKILSLSTSDWRYPYWTSRQFLMFELACRAAVVYATQRPDLRDVLRGRAANGRSSEAPYRAPPGMTVLSTRWPRTYRYRALDRAFSSAYVRRLQKHLDDGRGPRVVYAWNPSYVEIARRLSYEALLYHPYDMFRHFVDSPDELVQQETEMCALAHAVVTPHRQVADVLGHPNTHVINNGVFLPAFPDYRELRPVESLATIGRPLIGYVGAINDKIDFPLLLDVIGVRPDWHLVFVGFAGPGGWRDSPAYVQISKLPNVHFLEGVPINEVAHVMGAFDVGIVPYSLSGWARFSESPLKLYQYWAMGVPVVSTPLPNLEPDRGALSVGGTADEWRSGIAEQLGLRSDDLRLGLREKARSHSWAAKADRVMTVIRDLL